MERGLVDRLAPPLLWELLRPRIPQWTGRSQGGGTSPRDERAALAAVAFVLVTGCAWRHLPPVFGVSKATAHRRFVTWSEAGVWLEPDDLALTDAEGHPDVDWARTVLDAVHRRNRKTKYCPA